MSYFEPLAVALNQLRNNKVRSLLSLVGILIAVGAVTGIVSIGDGLEKYITGEFEQMGGYTSIWSWAPETWYRNDAGQWVQRTWEEHLTDHDIEALLEESDRIDYVIPHIGVGGENWLTSHKSVATQPEVISTTPEYPASENWRLAEGRFLTMYDLVNRAKVCVLGTETARNLFGDDVDPLEKEITIGDIRFQVVGLMEEKQFFDNNYNDRVMIPYTTTQARITGNDYIDYITVKVKDPGDIDEVVEAMRRVYRRLHEHGDEFNIQTGNEALAEINQVLFILKAVAGGIAAISLVVGGIGIMNIMLVSVTERTKEIGIRKSMGATRSAIMKQFLIESVVLCMFGGMLGLLMGFLLGQGIAALITALAPVEFISVIPMDMMVIAVVFSSLIGVVFGVYPAWQAASLHPVEALRHE